MSYKIPRGYLDKNTVSAEMPRTQAVTRAAPPMRTAVLRDPSKYMLKYVPYTDPSAVANVELAKGKIGRAFAAGMIELGKTFDAADASSQYTTAWNSFQLEAHGQLSILKDQGLTRPKQVMTAGGFVTDDDPTHVQLQATLHRGLLQQRDRWAKTIKDPKARAQFLQNSIATVVSLQKQAAEYARKKHVMYLQGKSFQQFQDAATVEKVLETAAMPHMKLIWTPTELNKKVNDRITTIVYEKNRVAILNIAHSPGPPGERDITIDEMRLRLMRGGHYSTGRQDSEGNVYYYDHIEKDGKRYKWDEFIPHENAKYLKKPERDKLYALLDAAEERIKDEIEKSDKENFNEVAIAIYTNIEHWSQDKITEEAKLRDWTATQLKTALGLRKSAQEGPVNSDIRVKLDILEHVDQWDFERIMANADSFSKEDLMWALRRRDGFDNKVDQWYDKGLGKQAIETLQMINGVDTSIISFSMPGMATSNQKAKAKYLEARVRLEARIQDISDDPREQGKEAWNIVKEMRRVWLESKKPPPITDAETDGADSASTERGGGDGDGGTVTATAVSDEAGMAVSTDNQIAAYRWATDNTTNDGTSITVRVAANLPAGYPNRAGIIAMYEDWGASFTESERVGVVIQPAHLSEEQWFLKKWGPALANRRTTSGGHSIVAPGGSMVDDPAWVAQRAAEISADEARQAQQQSDIDNYTLRGPNSSERTSHLLEVASERDEIKDIEPGGNFWFKGPDGTSLNMPQYEAYLKSIGVIE